MRLHNLILLVIALGCGWFGYQRLNESGAGEATTEEQDEAPELAPEPLSEPGRAPLRESTASDGGVWYERNRQAIRDLEAGRYQEAILGFEACVEALPERPVFRSNLVEALIRFARSQHIEGALSEAIANLERALELAAGEREDEDVLRELLARWRREHELEAEHETLGSDLFELSFDTRRDDLRDDFQVVLDHLERCYEDLREWFLHDPVREGGRARIKVVVYDKREFDAVTGLGDWAGGVFDGVVRFSVEDLHSERAQWEDVLRHELVHAFLYELGGGNVPGWLNEGLAQYLEAHPKTDLARERLAAALREGHELFPLERLAGSLASWEDTSAIPRAYAQSLVFVDHIAKNYGEAVLRDMVMRTAAEASLAQSFERLTGVPLDFVVEDVPRYLPQSR